MKDYAADWSDTESTSSVETNGTSVVAGPSKGETGRSSMSAVAGPLKRKAVDSPPRVFKRQPLPLVRGARGSETTLILANGKEVRGFDRTDL